MLHFDLEDSFRKASNYNNGRLNLMLVKDSQSVNKGIRNPFNG